MKFQRGKLYEIVFLDHCISSKGSGVITCAVVGWVVEQTRKTLTIAYWKLIDCDAETAKSNRETINIVKSTIVSAVALR